MKTCLLLIAALTLSACIRTPEPTLSAKNETTVTVQGVPWDFGAAYRDSLPYRTARDYCAATHAGYKGGPSYVGFVQIDSMTGLHTFAC